MSVTKRLVALVVGVLAFGALIFSSTGTANAKAYPKPPRITCTVTIVRQHFVIVCILSGYLPRHNVDSVLHTKPVDLGTVRVDGKGNGSVAHDVSKSFAGQTHTVIGTDTTVKSDKAQTTVKFPKASAFGTGGESTGGNGTGGSGTGGLGASGGGGGTSNTGVAVIGLGATGVILLTVGGLFVFSGRRRRVLA